MGTTIITGRFTVATDLDCIELQENGHLVIPTDMSELTINKLINNKQYPCRTDFEFLVTGKDGEDAGYGSDENGEDGEAGGKVKITVSNLIGDVHIKASGGIGGSGGKGSNGENGGDGGNGGNGGDGAIVEFHYHREDRGSWSYAFFHSNEGGFGGKGGSGGKCTGTHGSGGESEASGTKGAKYGDGGDGGINGKPGSITIFHPDGGICINNIEQDYQGSLVGITMLDLGCDRDLRIYLKGLGGEHNLRNFPHIRESIKKTREQSRKKKSDTANETITGRISQVEARGVGNINVDSNNLDTIFNHYSFNATIHTTIVNSSTVVTEEATALEPIGYMIIASMKEVKTEALLHKVTHFGDKGDWRSLDFIETDVYPYQKIAGKTYYISAMITYEMADGSLRTASMTSNNIIVEKAAHVSYLNQITINDPRWKGSKKGGEIMFLYGRHTNTLKSYESADYHGGDYLKNKFDGGKLRTIMPITGKITLVNHDKFEIVGAKIEPYKSSEGHFDPSFLEYNVSSSRKTIATHRPDLGKDKLGEALEKNKAVVFNTADTSVSFDLKLPPKTSDMSPYDWECNISGGFLDNSSHKCYLCGCFVLSIEHKPRLGSTTSTYGINIFSDDKPPASQSQFFVGATGSTTVYIPPILIYWGCHAADTLIMMADGSQKRADNIRIGDQLSVYGGKTLTIADILTGNDTEILSITTTDGRNIKVSNGHAMKMDDAVVSDGVRVIAAKLKPGDRLMTPGGICEVALVSVLPYDDMVYNFIFMDEDEPNYIEANGFWSGDFYAQNESNNDKLPELSAEAKALLAEFARFAKQ
ncbi:MAG: hypothetical protein LBC96_10270 [Lachnospiraceae bacterium]|nr:hypothetical protein [Lachnospiraceae bacterium]